MKALVIDKRETKNLDIFKVRHGNVVMTFHIKKGLVNWRVGDVVSVDPETFIESNKTVIRCKK